MFADSIKNISDGFYKSEDIWLKIPTAQPDKIDNTLIKPVDLTPICIPCPNWNTLNGCSSDKLFWKCQKCNSYIESSTFALDSKFYCNCGGADFNTYKFNCKNEHHPDEFVMYKKENLENKKMKPGREINILLLGETGVGKSTFINAFVNYLKFDSLEEAENEKLEYLIPCRFVITDDDYNEKQVVLGEDKNENFETGQSSTQFPKAHVISFENKQPKVRIIDTPGIGDTGGIEQDKKNLQNLLDYISQYEHLHAICILLKPNNARLGVLFNYVLKELLSNLHKKAVDNIIFCFTNSRGTFYRPGDTYPNLKKLLNDIEQVSKVKVPISRDNTFFFDNESFRFLAALQHKVSFTDYEKKDFSASWNHSVEVCQKMITYILNLPEHDVKETVTLNKVKRTIQELSKPLADITQNIQTNNKLAEDKLKELTQLDLSKADLEKSLSYTQIDLEMVPLQHPRTVCTSAGCTESVKINSVTKTNYTKHCHEHCGLSGVSVDVIAHPLLIRCSAMTNGVCDVCGCRWNLHMHITYDSKKVEKTVIDTNAQKAIKEATDKKDALEIAKKNIEDKIKANNDEQEKIIKISAKFAHFTKTNAIIPYNDEIENFLNFVIQDEKNKIQENGEHSEIYKNLLKTRDEYRKEKEIFETAASKYNNNESEVKLEDCHRYIKELYGLPINGKKIKDLINGIHEKKNNGVSRENQYQVKSSSKSFREKATEKITTKLKNLFF